MPERNEFCDHQKDDLGITCRRCGSWKRGEVAPPCPPYITRDEPDNKRLPHITSHEQNRLAWITWAEEEMEQHPFPSELADNE